MKKCLLLGIILTIGLLLRTYNLNFPSIGYHNMKENEYLSIAQEMLRTGDFVTRRIYFYNAFEENPTMRLYPQPPLVSYQILLSWKLLGENLWGPRLFNVFFGVLSILIMYFVAQLLFQDKKAAFFSALLLAVMPLAVFFSRNLQPESPAFFFMLTGSLFYLRFIRSAKLYNLLLGGIAFSIAWMYKFSFLLGILPFLFCLPYRKIFGNKKECLRIILVSGISFLLIVSTILVLRRLGQWQFEQQETLKRIRLLAVFTPAYWLRYGPMIWWYVRGENFTIVYVILIGIGVAVAFARRKELIDRYVIGSVFMLVVYCMIFSDHINQHNYYQMPFLAMVCLTSVYALWFIAEASKMVLQQEVFNYIFAIAFLASSLPIYQSLARMHGTVFLGEDVAGESLRELTEPQERVFLFTFAQGYGIARYARRYVGWTDNLEDFKRYEAKFGIRYACFYPAEMAFKVKEKNPQLFEYIQNNYHLKEAGLSEEPNKMFYVILEKGKGTPAEDFLKTFSGNMQVRMIYRILGRYVFFYSLKAASP